jgi:hypothetical protein
MPTSIRTQVRVVELSRLLATPLARDGEIERRGLGASRSTWPVLHAEHLDGTTRNHNALEVRRNGLQVPGPTFREERWRKDKISSVIAGIGCVSGDRPAIDEAVGKADPHEDVAALRTVKPEDLPPGAHLPDGSALPTGKQPMGKPDRAEGEETFSHERPEHELVVPSQVGARGGEEHCRVRHPRGVDDPDDGQYPKGETAERKGGEDDSADLPEGRLRDAGTPPLAEEFKQQPRSDEKDKEQDRQPAAGDHRCYPS